MLVPLVESGDLEVARHCAGCLATLLEDMQTHTLLVEADEGPPGKDGDNAGAILAAVSSGGNGTASEDIRPGTEGGGGSEGEDEGGTEEMMSGASGSSLPAARRLQGDAGANVGTSCESALLRLLKHPSVRPCARTHHRAVAGSLVLFFPASVGAQLSLLAERLIPVTSLRARVRSELSHL
jgi:hypothetical protein